MKRVLPILVACAMLGACASLPQIPTPPKMAAQSAGRYPVSIERGKWMGLNSQPLGIYVDGKPSASLLGGQSVTLYVQPGRHIIAVHPTLKRVPAGVAGSIAIDVSSTDHPILRTNVAALGYAGWKIEKAN